MSPEDKQKLLINAFSLSENCASYMAPYAGVSQIAPNSVVYYQDDPTRYLYVLISGHVRLTYINENGMVVLLSIVPPGQSFGETGAIDASPHCDTAFSSGAAELLRVDTACLRRDDPATANIQGAIASVIARRFRSHMDLTRALYMPSLALRLSHILLRMTKVLGNSIRYGGKMVECLGPIVTQQDLGSMARGTRENVNKTLRTWEKAGLIALEDRHILILKPQALEEIAANLG